MEAQELTGRLFEALLGATELSTVYLGVRLGCYESLAREGAATADELASRCGIHPRYALEWLEQQAVAGFVEVDDVAAEPGARRYTLPAAHAGVLADRDSPLHMASMPLLHAAGGRVLPQLVDAYRNGTGVGFDAHGDDGIAGQELLVRNAYRNRLASDWLPAVPGLLDRLRRGPGMQVADVGCGAGWSTIALARALPEVAVTGLDLDAASVEKARENARAEGLDVEFRVAGAADPGLAGRFGAVFFFDMLHEVGQPVAALRSARAALTDDGTVIVADSPVGDVFEAPGDIPARITYASSVVRCLPISMADQPSVATGSVLRPATLTMYALEAGFAKVEVLPIASGAYTFYQLHQ